jgi:hypothetical protein
MNILMISTQEPLPISNTPVKLAWMFGELSDMENNLIQIMANVLVSIFNVGMSIK